MLKIIGAALIGICFLDVGLFYGSQWFGMPNWSFLPQYNFFVFWDTDYLTYVGITLGGFLYYLGNKKSKKVQDDDQTSLNDENPQVERQSNSYFGLSLDSDSENPSKRLMIERRIFVITLYALVVTGSVVTGGIWSFWDEIINWKNSWSSSKYYHTANATESYEGDHSVVIQKWINLAQKGNVDAQFNLGVAYANGRGGNQDQKSAVKWYRRAAEKAHVGAQNNLGVMYLNGNILAEDNAYAHMWFNIAASLGYKGARDNKETIALIMTPKEISDAHRLARECILKKYRGC